MNVQPGRLQASGATQPEAAHTRPFPLGLAAGAYERDVVWLQRRHRAGDDRFSFTHPTRPIRVGIASTAELVVHAEEVRSEGRFTAYDDGEVGDRPGHSHIHQLASRGAIAPRPQAAEHDGGKLKTLRRVNGRQHDGEIRLANQIPVALVVGVGHPEERQLRG